MKEAKIGAIAILTLAIGGPVWHVIETKVNEIQYERRQRKQNKEYLATKVNSKDITWDTVRSERAKIESETSFKRHRPVTLYSMENSSFKACEGTEEPRITSYSYFYSTGYKKSSREFQRLRNGKDVQVVEIPQPLELASGETIEAVKVQYEYNDRSFFRGSYIAVGDTFLNVENLCHKIEK